MTREPVDVAGLRGLLAKATPGPWEVDTERNEDGAYGSGPDHGTGYDDFLIGAPGRDGKWVALFGSENSTAKLIGEDYDEDYHRAWDRTAEANAALIVAARNALPSLLDQLTEAQDEVARLREALTLSGDTKAAYMGEFRFTIPDTDEDGEECIREVYVSWDATKEIMAAILNRALLSGETR